LQLDIYGEAIDSLYAADQHGLQAGHGGWRRISDILDWLDDNWNQAEEGIWETRGGRQDFIYGRLMSWVAMDRGIRLADQHGRPAPLDRWRAERDAIYDQIMEAGWNEGRQAFVQHPKTAVLDSSLLRMTSVGFISPTDPMWTSTLDAMEGELITDSLVCRYDPEASPDGLRGSEGTFSLCTFAYVDSLARAGQLDQARNTFEKMLTCQPPRTLLRGNRTHRRTDRQLPSGLHPPRADRRSPHAEQPARSPVTDHVNVE
jgi:GH15 family glucan-1,4-alpha-glucosidase